MTGVGALKCIKVLVSRDRGSLEANVDFVVLMGAC